MTISDIAKKLGEDVAAAAKGALVTALKPLLKKFSEDLIQLVVDAAAKSPTPIDDVVVAAAKPQVEKLVDDLLAKI